MDYHRWSFPEKPDLMSEDDWEALEEELNKHFIKAQEGSDILRWGYSSKGSFSIKEAYGIKMSRNMAMEDI